MTTATGNPLKIYSNAVFAEVVSSRNTQAMSCLIFGMVFLQLSRNGKRVPDSYAIHTVCSVKHGSPLRNR